MDATTWPLAGLRVITPSLTLVYPDDATLERLVAAAARGVHDPDAMPFLVPWTERPPGEFERGFLQYHWGLRSAWSIDSWDLELAVIVDGDPIGIQGVGAKDFPTLREVRTGSWLVRSEQGRGIGKEMRAAVLHLAYAGLGAAYATTEAFEDNLASRGVTQSLGYAENGRSLAVRRGVASPQLHYRMSRDQWEPIRRDDIELVGLDAAREMFGI